jgi:hypothetical protein
VFDQIGVVVIGMTIVQADEETEPSATITWMRP